MYINNNTGYSPSKQNTFRFLGLNRNRYTQKGELEDMVNMSSREYPCAAPRYYRKSYADIPAGVCAVAAPDPLRSGSVIAGFTGIAGGSFYYDGVVKSGNYVLDTDCMWSIIRNGNLYILSGYNKASSKHILFYYNIAEDKFHEPEYMLDNLIVTAGKDSTGNYLNTFHYGYDAVTSYKVTRDDGTVIDCSKFFSEYGDGKYINKSNPFEEMFSVGDRVIISGFPKGIPNNGEIFSYTANAEIINKQSNTDYHINNTADTDSKTIYELDKYDVVYAYVKGFKSSSASVSGRFSYRHFIYFELLNKNNEPVDFDSMAQSSTTNHYCCGVTVRKFIPKFDNICVFNNSLFGSLPNGSSLFGSVSNDIFDYQSTDSNGNPLFTEVLFDSPGKCTGLAIFNNELLCFHENSITVIYGSDYSSYAKYVISGIGCIDPQSVAICPKGVIFLSYNGFYMFTGSSSPTYLSHAFKQTRFASAVGGYDCANRVYYACAVDSGANRRLYVYSLDYGIWHLEDDINVTGMFSYRGGYYIADKEHIYLSNMFPASYLNEWSFTSVRTHNSTLDNKTISEMWIRADCDENCKFKVEVSVDDDEWTEHGEYGRKGMYVYRVPVRTITGSTFRYRISGNGNVIIHEVELNMPISGRQYKDAEDAAVKLQHTAPLSFKY